MSRRPPKSSVGVDGPQQTCASRIRPERSSGAHRSLRGEGDGREAGELDWKGVVDYERYFRCRADSFAWNFQISSCAWRLRRASSTPTEQLSTHFTVPAVRMGRLLRGRRK